MNRAWLSGSAPRIVAAQLLPLIIALPVQAADTGKVRGFAVTWFAPAHFEDGNECPEGLTTGPVAETAALLARLSAAERKRLSDPKNSRELFQAVLLRGPGGVNVCAQPFSVPDPGYRSVKGKVGFGMDLDQDGATPSCTHEEFVSPAGEPGIDNQWYRLRGCMPSRRNAGFLPGYHNAMMRDGTNTILIEVRGIDDDRNDPAVEVGVYSGGDPLVTSADGEILPDATLNITGKPEWRAEARGRIENGIVITEPVSLLSLQADNATPPGWYEFRSARLRLELHADGTAKGMLAGYQPLHMLMPLERPVRGVNVGSLEFAFGGPVTCPGYFQAMQRLADGFPDPATGKCTAISSAYGIKAVPAFIVHRPIKPQMAGVVHEGAREE